VTYASVKATYERRQGAIGEAMRQDPEGGGAAVR
jgi:hypothetical protein